MTRFNTAAPDSPSGPANPAGGTAITHEKNKAPTCRDLPHFARYLEAMNEPRRDRSRLAFMVALGLLGAAVFLGAEYVDMQIKAALWGLGE